MGKQPTTLLDPSSPDRLLAEQAAPRLGLKKHGIPSLVKARLLKPLGNPKRIAVKYYAASVIEKLARDQRWLSRATEAVYNDWSTQNQERRSRNIAPDRVPAALDKPTFALFK